MKRDVQPPALDEHGYEVHPAFGNITVNRVTQSPPGQVLYGSDIRHQHYVVVTIRSSSRKRDLHRDWHHADLRPHIEIAMSESQWAQFVSSFGNGEGTDCTLTSTREEPFIPGLPFDSRLALTAEETAVEARRGIAKVQEALAAVEEKPTKANVRALRLAVDALPANMKFAAESLTEHTEKVVTKARADIEAMVTAKARALGIEAADVMPALEAASGGEES